MKRTCIFLGALFLFAPLLCLAQEYVTFGQGVTSCGQYLEDRKGDSLDAKLASLWLQGYLTRFARDERIAEVSTDVPSMMQWIENYCRDNPLRDFAYAAAMLTRHLSDAGLVKHYTSPSE